MHTTAPPASPPLESAAWRALAAAHRRRAEAHTRPVRERRARGVPDPVGDFLFEYYPYPPSRLERWHPGLGVALKVGPGWEKTFSPALHCHQDGVITLDPARLPAKAAGRVAWIARLLTATRDRAPNFACHGMHEWAMVYRAGRVRHEGSLPLRLAREEIDAVVRSRPIACSHHDAFRFFTEAARPLNRLQPSFDTRIDHEQPACVHANMDLYKWASKLMPWCGSALLLDAFELAFDLRELDMRASPYDLASHGLAPVPIETPAGRRKYESLQRALATRARPIRSRLIATCKALVPTQPETQHPDAPDSIT